MFDVEDAKASLLHHRPHRGLSEVVQVSRRMDQAPPSTLQPRIQAADVASRKCEQTAGRQMACGFLDIPPWLRQMLDGVPETDDLECLAAQINFKEIRAYRRQSQLTGRVTDCIL